MLQKECYYPFGDAEINLTPAPPRDIVLLLESLSEIQRFQSPKYPMGVLVDNDFTHAQRCAGIAEACWGTPSIVRMMWIHDVVELQAGDVVASVKESSPGMLRAQEDYELALAKNMLTPSDFDLYYQMWSAHLFMEGLSDSLEGLSAEGVVGNTIDRIEGNMFYHYYMSQWARAHGQAPSQMTYTLDQAERYFKRLSLVPYRDAAYVSSVLLIDQIRYVDFLWAQS